MGASGALYNQDFMAGISAQLIYQEYTGIKNVAEPLAAFINRHCGHSQYADKIMKTTVSPAAMPEQTHSALQG